VRPTASALDSVSAKNRQPGKDRGFTLVELLAAIAIIAILAVLVAPNYKSWLAKASQAKCMANMRSIHLALGSYLNDNRDIWPQGPSPLEGDAWAEFWVKRLEPQGVSPRTWECPAIYRMLGNPPRDKVKAELVHYIPTMFDDKPGTARQWPTQPWLVERADAHGNGALICFTDGSIKPFNKVLAELGNR
jgi:prepilin-type N-terminal cleavage/methylation domain-containing protein